MNKRVQQSCPFHVRIKPRNVLYTTCYTPTKKKKRKKKKQNQKNQREKETNPKLSPTSLSPEDDPVYTRQPDLPCAFVVFDKGLTSATNILSDSSIR